MTDMGNHSAHDSIHLHNFSNICLIYMLPTLPRHPYIDNVLSFVHGPVNNIIPWMPLFPELKRILSHYHYSDVLLRSSKRVDQWSQLLSLFQVFQTLLWFVSESHALGIYESISRIYQQLHRNPGMGRYLYWMQLRRHPPRPHLHRLAPVLDNMK